MLVRLKKEARPALSKHTNGFSYTNFFPYQPTLCHTALPGITRCLSNGSITYLVDPIKGSNLILILPSQAPSSASPSTDSRLSELGGSHRPLIRQMCFLSSVESMCYSLFSIVTRLPSARQWQQHGSMGTPAWNALRRISQYRTERPALGTLFFPKTDAGFIVGENGLFIWQEQNEQAVQHIPV